MRSEVSLLSRAKGRVTRAIGYRRLRRGSHPAPPAEPLPGADRPLPPGQFVNPIAEGADPYVVRDGDAYLWCQTVADVGVAVCRSDRLTSLGERVVVWEAPETGMWSKEVWAPELIRLDGRWHIYVAASDGHNRNHRAYVLVADTDDPRGSYTLHGPLETGDVTGSPQWAIDLTVLEHGGRRYALWSGWPDDATRVQHLYIAPMASPTELAGPRVLMTSPYDYPWERIREDDPEPINEGPQVLVHGGRTFVVYSCGSALLPSYKLGLLELVGDDPLDPASWHKSPEPLFTSTEQTFGVGHGTFVPSPDGTQWWAVYHRKIVPDRNFKRVLHVQPMTWSATGEPLLGEPVAAGVPLDDPSGTRRSPRNHAGAWDLTDGDIRRDFDYFGHQQFLLQDADGLQLGRLPERPVNAFRTGEKVVLRDGDYDAVRVTAEFTVLDGKAAVGILLRCTAPAVGVDAQRGYFVGWVASTRRLLIGRTDGATWTLLGTHDVTADPGRGLVLVAEADGSRIRGRLSGVSGSELEVEDATYDRGSVGLRVVHTHARFTRLAVEPLPR